MNVKYNVAIPFYVMTVDNHKDIKQKILDLIAKEPKVSKESKNEKIDKYDWSETDTNSAYKEYFQFVFENIREKFQQLSSELHCDLKLMQYWFQQYTKTGEHGWHNHPYTTWSCVYYVELPDDAPRTKFRSFTDRKEFEIPNLKEGDILIFPGVFHHCSPPNNSESRKTVVVFNFVEALGNK